MFYRAEVLKISKNSQKTLSQSAFFQMQEVVSTSPEKHIYAYALKQWLQVIFAVHTRISMIPLQ